MKVYTWTGSRSRSEFDAHFPGADAWRIQTQEIVAARSKAEVYRITGGRRGDHMNIGETGNREQIEAALASPGVVLWRPLDSRTNKWAHDA